MLGRRTENAPFMSSNAFLTLRSQPSQSIRTSSSTVWNSLRFLLRRTLAGRRQSSATRSSTRSIPFPSDRAADVPCLVDPTCAACAWPTRSLSGEIAVDPTYHLLMSDSLMRAGGVIYNDGSDSLRCFPRFRSRGRLPAFSFLMSRPTVTSLNHSDPLIAAGQEVQHLLFISAPPASTVTLRFFFCISRLFQPAWNTRQFRVLVFFI
jgi:hypothetical protein